MFNDELDVTNGEVIGKGG